MVAWDGRKLRRIGWSLALLLLQRPTKSLSRKRHIDVDLDSEEYVIPREESPFLRVKVTGTGAMGYLRCEGRPHLHEFVTGVWSGKAELSFAV